MKKENSEEPRGASGSTIQFILPITPKSIQHGSRIRRGGKGMFNDPAKQLYYDQIVEHARFDAPKEPWEGPIGMQLIFYLPRPKKYMGKGYPDDVIFVTGNPDVTNLIKGTEDGLSKAGFWKNDSQVVTIYALKVYHEKTGKPGIHVIINKLS